ncbi:hypothetical protein HELRODRAFT_182519 [Helobdella robusta]|uniref:Endonuclease/exonuclease/phosphatase domain-containing protein n=1 Tax=Helobdella robusta TaxID=6412 RepID=T1FIB2_HELRO|nr:hypothetical protein HELRODRAFT_182519 [Helobdella robusta]ESN90927.1 hypothetical protein HELRODRAFT_182519 [Helobdella robusta]
MGTKKKPKDTSLEMRTTESDLGLKLCEDCLSCNREILAQILKENLLCESSVPSEEWKLLAKNIEDSSQASIKQLEYYEKLTKATVVQNEQTLMKYSDVVRGGVNLLSSDVKMMKELIQATSTKMDVINEREKRKNNIILYNMFKKENIKESVNKLLKEISGTDLGTEVVEISRLGRKSDEEKSRPVLVQFSNYTVKNLILNNCTKLKKSLNFNKVIINHDLSREDKISNSKILEERKKEIGEKDDVSRWQTEGRARRFLCYCFQEAKFTKVKNSSCNNSNNLSVIMTNVDSITNKFFDLKIFLQSLDVAPDLIALSEVNPKNFNQCRVLSEFCLDDYSIISSGFAEQHRRGLMLFCKRSLLLTEINLNSSFKEYIIVKLCVSNRVLNILFVYRSPNSNVGNNDLLLKLINDVLALPGETLLFGDFNFPDINWDTSSFEGNDERVENRFLDLLKDKFLIQHINHLTRFRDGQTSNILDLVTVITQFWNSR